MAPKTLIIAGLVLGLFALGSCGSTETSPPKPQPTEAQKKALLEANEILTACAASDIEKVKATLKKNPELINAQDDVGATPLWRAVAALHSSDELVKLLLEKGANVEGATKLGETPLQIAAGKGRKDIVLSLLEHGAKIGAQDRYGRSALSYAAFGNRIEVADLLIARGAAIDVMEAAALGKTKKLEEFLREDPNSAKAKDDRGLTPLHWAARNGHVGAVRLLLGHGASAFEEDRFGVTPCSGAREFKHADIVALMRCP
jgi:ankyrin repeat protein